MTTRTELSPQQTAFFDRLKSGKWELPPGIRNMGIRPQDWLKEVSYGRVLYQWPNTGDRDIGPDRAFGGWVAGLSDHIVSMTMASALDDGEWFTTMELQTRILRPVPNGLITIEGRLISRGRTTALVEADWRDEKGRHLARITAAKAIRAMAELRPEA
ncbi:MAG: PaaI family thioesterase [Hyphomonas sp.]|uniref:PaaI family thioesterase n=1 Tax=Hyphomonas sp. TaxID=87 RepID=UPI0017BA93C3|nr:PaaI family thioesterase [Hyphomonas sp.]MBA3067067.1 PaaI family thioesterase [Hyphomonas sp.]MBU3921320.1 PaaI family thioesterase [Alphaproteobacteria bacterium]MBU4063138.1 PaaI family thioesterase [Alphaproteobacteria bacterium]MBU4164455.1 PaaI family thioesterase [Alphaproteobacteria bacterium]